MKTISKFLPVLLLIIVTSLGCKKIPRYTIDEYYLKNNTDDTLFVKYSYEIGDVLNPHDTIYKNYKLLSSQKISFPFLSLLNNNNKDKPYERHYIFLNIIYKNHKVRFKFDSLPYNYLIDFYDIKNWERTHKIDFVEDEYGTKGVNAVYVTYIFPFDTLKIIDINEK
jgi:hypothetical protein